MGRDNSRPHEVNVVPHSFYISHRRGKQCIARVELKVKETGDIIKYRKYGTLEECTAFVSEWYYGKAADGGKLA